MRITFTRSLFLLSAILLFATISAAQVSVAVVVNFAPPELPVYEQPVCPSEGHIWTPGYWAWDGGDYYWVPGTWVQPPAVGYLWTPGYWGWSGGGFIFHEGYWGPEVGFYGGINYRFGYFGHGYEGGRWDHNHFYYNRSVNNINVTQIHNVYNTTIVNNNTNVTRVSYNGGNGGVTVRSTSQQEAFGPRTPCRRYRCADTANRRRALQPPAESPIESWQASDRRNAKAWRVQRPCRGSRA
jgi:hypothetical protein